MKTILIVDDIEANRFLLSRKLRLLGDFEVIEAKDGGDAIAKFVRSSPDLILMDIKMPNMNGYESAAEIKKLGGAIHTPIIFVTGMGEETSLTDALESGGDDFIAKPYSTEVLRSKVRAHLRIRDLNTELQSRNTELSVLNQRLKYEQFVIEQFFERVFQQNDMDPRFIRYHMSAMSIFSGDVLLVRRSPAGHLFVIMGDFTGHGLTAAMGTLPVAQVFFKMVQESASVAEIATEVNLQLNILLPSGLFFAATVACLDAGGDTLTVWAGGMPDSYVIDSTGQFKHVIESQHLALGILSQKAFEADTLTLTMLRGDLLYLYSDGIVEAQSPSGEMFNDDRLRTHLQSPALERFERMIVTLSAFRNGSAQKDDMTFIEVGCRALPESAST